MRTVLLNLPWSVGNRLGVRSGSRWPFTSLPEKDGKIHYLPFPFFLAYATSLLKKYYQDVKLIDAIAEEIEANLLIDKIGAYDPDLIIIETSTPSFYNDIGIAKNIYDKLPNCQIAFCGPHVSVFPEEALKEYSFIDYILIGEYEYTLLDLVRHLDEKLPLNSVLGLAYKENSKIAVNNRRPTIDDLDSLPWPERETLPIYKYNDGFAGLPQPNVQMWASRGCPFRCSFCLWPQILYREHKYRKRDPVDIANEMDFLIEKFNFQAVYFDDDTFNIDRNHVLSICREIKKRGIQVSWAAMARADLMDEKLLKHMANSGLYAIKYGIESANQKILSFCRKDIDLEKAKKIIKLTKQIGIKVHLTFSLGLYGETKQTLQETVNFIQETNSDSTQFSFATPFPGTEYFNYLEQKGMLLSKEWSDYDGNQNCIIETPELTSVDLEQIKLSLVDTFKLR